MTVKLGSGIKLVMPAVLCDQGFVLRQETEDDIPFLCQLYVSTRWEELAPIIDWTEAQKREFLKSQFSFQRQHYRTYYPTAEFAVLERYGVPVGRIYVGRQKNTLIVIDVSLLPESRGRGTGTTLMQAVCAEAKAAGEKVSICVEKFNPAQRLYRRLGFREVADEGMHWVMEWRAADAAPDSKPS